MKKFRYIVMAMLLIAVLAGCGKEETKQPELKPEEEKMQEICQLVTHDYVCNMVAKDMKLPEKGWTHWLEKERTVWIQYEGVVPVGVELPENAMEIVGTEVKIKAPKAVVMDPDINEKTLTKESFIISEDGFWNSNEVTAEFQQELIANAQQELKSRIEKDQDLLEKAEIRAKNLIENYIKELGKVTETEYTIHWVEDLGGKRND